MVSDLTDEERELVKGMPPAVAEGFIAARRTATRNRWADLADRGVNLQNDLWGEKR